MVEKMDHSFDFRERLDSMVTNANIEIIPSDKILERVNLIPKGSTISVTASPSKPIEETLIMSANLKELGFRVIPHIAARRIIDIDHLRQVSDFLDDMNIDEVFVIGGDKEPFGDYPDSVKLLEDLLNLNHSIKKVGVGGYPEGHPLIKRPVINEFLKAKIALAKKHGIEIHINSQACYVPGPIVNWIKDLHDIHVNIPILLGISAPMDMIKLAQTSKEIGVGDSVAFLTMVGLDSALKSTLYDPGTLLNSLVGKTESEHITDLHLFTFNHVKSAMQWQQNFKLGD